MARKIAVLAALLVLCQGLAYAQDAATAASKSAPVITLPPWVLHAKLVHDVPVQYPTFIRDQQAQDVFVDVVVAENGKVQKADWVNCLNCSSMLGEAAENAVKQWEYQPILLNGKPVSVISWVAFRFRTGDGPSVEILTKSESSTPSVKPSKAPGPKKLRIVSGVAESNIIHKVEPEYPRVAKIAHVQGDVFIQCLINRDGEITEARIVSGPPLLLQAALDAIKQWKYKPYLLNGEPVRVETTITVRFHL